MTKSELNKMKKSELIDHILKVDKLVENMDNHVRCLDDYVLELEKFIDSKLLFYLDKLQQKHRDF